MADRETCPAVESVPGRFIGAWVFKDTRVPVSSLFANLAEGATVEDFLDWFPGVEAWQVKAVLEHEIKHLDSSVEMRMRIRRTTSIGAQARRQSRTGP